MSAVCKTNKATKEQQGERELHRVFRAMKEKINKEEELVNRKAPTDK